MHNNYWELFIVGWGSTIITGVLFFSDFGWEHYN